MKMFLSNPTIKHIDIIRNTKISNELQGKIKNVWCPTENYQACKEEKKKTRQRKINSNSPRNDTQMIELVETDIKIHITVFSIFKKLKERLKLLSRDIKDIKKEPN